MEAGRPTKYETKYNTQAYKLCLLGAIDRQLADFFEVNEDTIHEWKKVHPKFKAAILRGKKHADMKVAEALFKKATGFKTEEVTFEKCGDKQTVEVTKTGDLTASDEYKIKVVTKEIAPDTVAGIFWLKNRDKDNWRDKQEVEVTQKTIKVIVDGEDQADIDDE